MRRQRLNLDTQRIRRRVLIFRFTISLLTRDLDLLARHRNQLRGTGRMAEIRNTIPILTTHARLARENHTVHRAAQNTIRPMTQQIAEVDEHRWQGVGFCSRRFDGDRSPSAAAGEDFQARLPGPLEEESDATIVAVSAGADVDFGLIIGEIGERWVVEEA